MARPIFVTGTDTGVGKTWASAAILRSASKRGLRTLAMKPVAAGCEQTPDGWRNEDALLLQANMSESLAYEQINPVALQAAVAPHLAAARQGARISLQRLEGFCRGLMLTKSDLFLVEGAGGWRVPLNEREFLSGLAKNLEMPVILVIDMRLGCLNHALLTAEAIRRDGLTPLGWIANQTQPEPMPLLEENLATLGQWMGAPCLGRLPYSPEQLDAAAAAIDLDTILLGKSR